MKRFSGRDWWFILLFGAIYMFNFIDRMIISVVGEPIRREFGLSDLQLPDGHGLDLIRETRHRHPETEIMVISILGHFIFFT
eukprot:gene6019-8157_t